MGIFTAEAARRRRRNKPIMIPKSAALSDDASFARPSDDHSSCVEKTRSWISGRRRRRRRRGNRGGYFSYENSRLSLISHFSGSDSTSFLFPISSLPTSRFPLPTSHFPLPTSYFPLLIPCFPLHVVSEKMISWIIQWCYIMILFERD